ncbi:hypothetical protein GCM10011309_07970 [Litorimonas cladophorae]|uniref:Response regulator n=1 Tax=Litorimonas cladophorae TaxID=1220491 RepID=A0A918KES0_9PROT|nr:response regulator [Litorimonas cladophorae]GGX60540.1 hypothetical protein GCM10011309_07970 [Litorimonas cladophorae]
MVEVPTIPPLQILLADDNDANRLISRTILERAGHSVTTARNGSHALSLAKFATFELIILDIMMPVMDGMRALRQLRRSNSVNEKTPIFALTAYCSAADRQRYFLSGFDSVLSKPLRPGDLENAYIRHKDHRHSPVVQAPDNRPSAGVPLLDAEMISQLSQVADAERLAAIQSRFWISIETKCEMIKRALPDALRGDGQFLSQFRRAVHAVKGASAAIGLSRVAHIARDLQNAPPSDIAPLMRAFADALTESRPALTAALSQTEPSTGARQLDAPMQMRG